MWTVSPSRNAGQRERRRLRRAALLALAAMSSTALTRVAQAAEFPAVIPLSSLSGSNGFRLDGVAADDKLGGRPAGVGSAGDVNGDGFADLIMGAYFADPHGSNSGASYVVFGKPEGFAAAIDLSSLDGGDGFRLDGVAAGNVSGLAVAGAGDLNGDGFDDVMVGAINTGTYEGLSYVVFGKSSGFPASIDLSSLNGKNGFRLFGADSDLAFFVSGAGDVNGDGFADVIIGGRGASPHGSQSGSSYVVFGKAAGFPATINLSSFDGDNGFRLDGEATYDSSGKSVAGAGDVNGDGFDDVIIGAYRASPHGQYSGKSYVVFGKASDFAAIIDLSTLDGNNGFRLDGVAAYDLSGQSVAGAGDVNGDGFADLVMSNYNASPHGFASGSTYVVFGKPAGFAATIDLSSLNGRNGFRLDGEAVEDASGSSVAGAGDVNGDGFADVIIGAFGADPHGSGSGSSYVVFGRAPDSARTRVGSAAGQYISGGGFADTLKGRDGDDVLEGRQGPDELIGGKRGDTASYLHAGAGVRASLATPAINTGQAKGDGYTSIENLTGSRFGDRLIGDGGANRLTGAEGPDVLTGGGGPDLLVLNALRDSPPGAAARDRIVGFNAGTAATFVDRIDLSAIDARTGPGNQAFTYIGRAPFTSVKGQLRVRRAGPDAVVEGDVNGDAAADLQIELSDFTALPNLTAIDFER